MTSAIAIAFEQTNAAETWMEHRWGRRRPCHALVCIAAGGGLSGTGGLRNVSMSGAYLETTLRLPLFAQIDVSVVLGDGSRCAECTATVVRRDAKGVGIEWADAVSGSVCDALGCRASCPFAEDHA